MGCKVPENHFMRGLALLSPHLKHFGTCDETLGVNEVQRKALQTEAELGNIGENSTCGTYRLPARNRRVLLGESAMPLNNSTEHRRERDYDD